MTRTARGARKSGSDNYPTPDWAIRRFLDEWDMLEVVGNRWLEPSVGDGVIVDVCNEYRSDLHWATCDIRDVTALMEQTDLKGGVHTTGDFFKHPRFQPRMGTSKKPWDVAIMNPPFRLTMDFISRCLKLCECVIMLQRINYCATFERNEFFRRATPDLYVVPNRLSHTGDGKSDSVEAAWHVWGPHEFTQSGEFRILKHTPVDERKKSAERVKRARNERTTAIDTLFAAAGR